MRASKAPLPGSLSTHMRPTSLSPLILTTSCDYGIVTVTHSVDEKMEAQRRFIICLKPLVGQAQKQIKPSVLGSQSECTSLPRWGALLSELLKGGSSAQEEKTT